MRRDATTTIGVIWVAIVALLGGCEPDPPCVVARFTTGDLRLDEARHLSALMLPPPPHAEAMRLAVDVEVACRESGVGAMAPASEKLDAYRPWILAAGGRTGDWAAVSRAMRDVRERAGFRPGPCHPDAAPSGR